MHEFELQFVETAPGPPFVPELPCCPGVPLAAVNPSSVYVPCDAPTPGAPAGLPLAPALLVAAVQGTGGADPVAPCATDAAAPPPATDTLTLSRVNEPAFANTPYSDCPAEAVVSFSTVSVSSVHVPAEVVVTALVCPAGAAMMDVAFVPLQLVQLPAESAQPPWIVTLAASSTTSVYLP